MRKLEIGPGSTKILEDWETMNIVDGDNVDYVADLEDGIPFTDNSFDLIYGSHVLEHVPWFKTVDVLKDILRALKPGGSVELWVPDFDKILHAYNQEDISLDGWLKHNPDKDLMTWLNGRVFSYGPDPNWHKSLFNEEYLKKCLTEAGFGFIERLNKPRGADHGYINLGVRGVKKSVLPPKSMRKCNVRFKDDKFFWETAISEGVRVKELCGEEKNILDIGCGVGRLAIGVNEVFSEPVNYYGVDVDNQDINWCLKNSWNEIHDFSFIYIDIHNDRYNPGGEVKMSDTFRLPFVGKFSVIYLYSVFSHLLEDDIRIYLREFKRLLDQNGTIFLTMFIERNVPDVEENPENYPADDRNTINGPLHRVRYNVEYFESMLNDYGLTILNTVNHAAWNKQSMIYIQHK